MSNLPLWVLAWPLQAYLEPSPTAESAAEPVSEPVVLSPLPPAAQKPCEDPDEKRKKGRR